MHNWPIQTLTHTDPHIAETIRSLMVAAYQVEAEILGVVDFVPLYRTAQHIAATDARFFGISADQTLIAAAEVEYDSPNICYIGSLVVHPAHFRKGLATALLRHIIITHPAQTIAVSTGQLNAPALKLYAAHHFVNHRLWTTPDGIPMITLQRPPSLGL